MSRELVIQSQKTLLSSAELEQTIDEMALKILDILDPNKPLALVGLASRGVPLAEKLHQRLLKTFKSKIALSQIDATFYRDDLHTKRGFKNPSIPSTSSLISLEGSQILLVDDVFYTGRSARAAINALMDLGRPDSIRFMVLIDRDQRELPIRPDVSGKVYKTQKNEEVRVLLKPIDETEGVDLVTLGASI